jgi:hypothetical protein
MQYQEFFSMNPRPHSHRPAYNLNMNLTLLANGNDTVRD